MENIIKGIRQYYPVSETAMKALRAQLTEQHFSKHHLLTRAGVRDHSVYFIEQGCARTYLLIDGKEITNWFSREGDITFSSYALYHRKPGFEYVELLEDAVLYTISIEALNRLYTTHIDIANWSRVIHQEVLLKMQTLRIDRLSLPARERYRKFQAENPDLCMRVNLGHIASYLGMTQQYLSSLRTET